MKNFTPIILLSLFFSCNNYTSDNETEIHDSISVKMVHLDKLPEIGEFLADSIKMTSNNKKQLVNSSNFSPATFVIYEGVEFAIAWNEAGVIGYISTTDTTFVTPENVRISTTLQEIKKLQNVEINKMPGWGYYVNLESGWKAAFCVDKNCTGRDILDLDSVKWIYK